MHINRQERSLDAGAGAGTKHRNQEAERSSFKEKYTTPQGAGISAAVG